MSWQFRTWVTALMAVVGVMLSFVAIVVANEGDPHAGFVYGLWGAILLAVGCLVLFGVRHRLSWRLVGAATLVAALAYFASGYYSGLSVGENDGVFYMAMAGVVGGYFAITGGLPKRLPFLVWGRVIEVRTDGVQSAGGEKSEKLDG